MEGDRTYKESYDAICKAIKANRTGNVNLNYSKFDERTAAEIRLAVDKALLKRKSEVWAALEGTK